jgi:DNA integrity scanning protein DisA with diadenylate cyclase activity/mannitol/fructose-specific phosphotransferase system IIA component (Ntr-type)
MVYNVTDVTKRRDVMINLSRSMESDCPNKESLLPAMVHHFFSDKDDLFKDKIISGCLAREEEASTMVDKGIAFPHSVIKERISPQILCCYSPTGVPWNSTGEKVSIIILLVCNEEDHLPTLSELAGIFQMPGVTDKLGKAKSAEDMSEVLLRAQSQKEKNWSKEKEIITNSLLREADRLRSNTENTKMVLFSNSLIQILSVVEQFSQKSSILVSSKSRVLNRVDLLKKHFTVIHSVQGSISYEKEILKQLWTEKILSDGDVVISLSGFEFDMMPHSISITAIPRDLYDESRVLKYKIPHNVNLEILSRAVSLASELSRQGREGKSVGTIFVVGEYESVQDYCKQLIINPFGGLEDYERSILDAGLSETIKEFSKIDGAYIVENSGKIRSGGTYLSIPPHQIRLQPGLGARHAAALGITLVAPVASVVLSESTGHIRIFWDGMEQDLFVPGDR